MMRFLPGALLLLILVGWSSPARAYAWMIKHEYTSCTTCHADPSGGGLLTPYGRAQAETLLRSQYGRQGADAEPGKIKDFLWGAIPLPEENVLLGGDFRSMYMHNWLNQGGSTISDGRLIYMLGELRGQVTVDRFRANASLGFDHRGAQLAAITHRPEDNLVSRVHWVGVDLGEDKQWLVRAGRMNVPFGIRQIEHTMWVRNLTRTDINAAQQHGVSVAYNREGIRAEFMGILGNYQLNPDAYRQRGYSGYIEYSPWAKVALGVSSLVTHASRDLLAGTSLTRQAHGLFARMSPWGPLVLSAEGDFLVNTQPSKTYTGFAGLVQADLEPWQGLHFILSTELKRDAAEIAGWSYAGWASAAWFFAPHADVRIDGIRQHLSSGNNSVDVTTFLAQLHVFL